MAAVLRRSVSFSSSIVALIVFVIVMESARHSSADAATESLKCEAPSIPLEVIDLMFSVNDTLKTIKNILSPPSGGEEEEEEEEEEEGSCDTSSSKEPVVQTGLLLLLLRKMEANYNQLSRKVNRLEEDHAGIRESPSIKNVPEAESQKSDTSCHCIQWPRDCHELLRQGKNESGIYSIYPQKEMRCGIESEGGVRVWCDLEGEEAGWTTVLLRRPLEDQVDFNQMWQSYKIGFGNPETEYWIGNDVLHAMTTGRMQMLRVDMTDWDGNTAYAEYDSIKIDSEDEEFRLHLGGYSGNARDALRVHNDMLFSTPDRDNDKHGGHCARDRKAGFWYMNCHYTGPTHPLLKKQKNSLGMCWYDWHNDWTTLQKMIFKLKPSKCLGG